MERIPPPVVKRFSYYLSCVDECVEEGKDWISSRDIAESIGITTSTVRYDISFLDVDGTRNGYRAVTLREALSKALGLDKGRKVVIVGAGNLGRALAQHEEFEECGFHICGIFDIDPSLVGKKVGRLKVRSMKSISAFLRKERPDIGVIAVPAESAQEAADILVEHGIGGILNMASTHIITPPTVPVVHARIVASMRELSCAIRLQRTEES